MESALAVAPTSWQASVPATIYQPTILPPLAELPPPSLWFAGYGIPTELSFIFASVRPVYCTANVTPLDELNAVATPVYQVQAKVNPLGDIEVTAIVISPKD